MNFIQQDYQGSVRAVLNNDGHLTNLLSYNGFGISTQTNPAPNLSYGYTGSLFDPVLNAQDDSARWFYVTTGTFMTPDPWGEAGSGTNLTLYVKNEFTDASDPSGKVLLIDKDTYDNWSEFTKRHQMEFAENEPTATPRVFVYKGSILHAQQLGASSYWTYTNLANPQAWQALSYLATQGSENSRDSDALLEKLNNLKEAIQDPSKVVRVTSVATGVSDSSGIPIRRADFSLTGNVNFPSTATDTPENKDIHIALRVASAGGLFTPPQPTQPNPSIDTEALAIGSREGVLGGTVSEKTFAEGLLSQSKLLGETVIKSIGENVAEQYAVGKAVHLGGLLLGKGWKITKGVITNASGKELSQLTKAEIEAELKAVAPKNLLTNGRLTPRGQATVIERPKWDSFSAASRRADAAKYAGRIRELEQVGRQGLPITTAMTDQGRKLLFEEMAAITRATGKEVALVQRTDGTVAMVIGEAERVALAENVRQIIGHTHPSGRIGLSKDLREINGRYTEVGDVALLRKLDQEETWVIVPDGVAKLLKRSEWDW